MDVLASTDIIEKWRSVETVEVVEVCFDRTIEEDREHDELDDGVMLGFSWFGSIVEVEATESEEAGRCLSLGFSSAVAETDLTRSVSTSRWEGNTSLSGDPSESMEEDAVEGEEAVEGEVVVEISDNEGDFLSWRAASMAADKEPESG